MASLRDLETTIISCRQDYRRTSSAGLYDGCLADLELVLINVLYLLDVGISGQVEFVERGQRRDQTGE